MRIGVYYTDGKFTLGERLEVDREFIEGIDAGGVWFYIKFFGEKILIASRFDNIKPPDIGRYQRYVAVAEEYKDKGLLEIYKEFIIKFDKLLRENGWEWKESREVEGIEMFSPELRLDVHEIGQRRIEGICKMYPSIKDRLNMIWLAERIIHKTRIPCIFYSNLRPWQEEFANCFWISSRRFTRADERFEKLRLLEDSIERRDHQRIEEFAKERDFIDLISKLDAGKMRKFFRTFPSVVLEYTKRYPECKTQIRELAEKANFESFLHELENLIYRPRVQPSAQPSVEHLVQIQPKKDLYQKKVLLGIVVSILLLSAALAVVLFLSFPSKPDLAAKINVNPEFPILGDNVSINVTIENKGGEIGNATEFEVVVYCNLSGSEIWNDIRRINLSARNSLTFSENWKPEKEGKYEIKVVLDTKNEINESNENNNVANKQIIVRSPHQSSIDSLSSLLKKVDNALKSAIESITNRSK